jgi:hypothetical protein
MQSTVQVAGQAIHDNVKRYLQRWDEFGAADSEGWQMLDFIFRTVYGEE